MTKLEEEIAKAIIEADYPHGNFYVGNHIDEMTFRSKAAAEVAKRYIEKAFDQGALLYSAQFILDEDKKHEPLEEMKEKNG